MIRKALLLLLWLPTVCDSFSSPRRQFTTVGGNPNFIALSNSSDVFSGWHLVASTSSSSSVDASMVDGSSSSSMTRLQMKANDTYEHSSSSSSSSSIPNGNNHNKDLPWRIYGRFKQYVTAPIRKVKQFLRRTAWKRPSAIMEPFVHAAAAATTTTKTPRVGGTTTTSSSSVSSQTAALPARSATASVDLSGTWDLIVTADFKQEYDEYMRNMGVPFLARSVAMNVIGLTTEETVQTDQGRTLLIRSKNVKGVWERTLIASSGLENETMHKEDAEALQHILTPILTADEEQVVAEAWWENNGTVHHSWLRGVKKYGGGNFESLRYLEQNGRVLVCESIFHPNDTKRKKATITWRFQKH